MHDDLVVERTCLGNHLPGWGDDAGPADLLLSFLQACLGSGGYPKSVLVGASLHGKVAVKQAKAVERRRFVELGGGVVSDQHDFGPVEAQHAIGLRPTAIVAERNRDANASEIIDRKAEIPRLKIKPLQAECRSGLRLLLARQMHLAVASDEPSVPPNEIHRVEPPVPPVLADKFR